MKMGFVSLIVMGLMGNAQAGLFDTIDSVGVIQAKDQPSTNREPAAAPNASATTTVDEDHSEDPAPSASAEAPKTEKSKSAPKKKSKTH